MSNAYRDENDVPTLIASSNVDGKTPIRIYADPVTHRLLVDLANGGMSVEVPSESPDGSRTTFTLAHTPLVVVVDQARTMRSGVGWTYAGTTLTLDVAPLFDVFSEY